MFSARELFSIGRRFKMLLPNDQGKPRLTEPFTVSRHSQLRCFFVADSERWKQALKRSHRRLHWVALQNQVLADNVRWLNSLPPGTKPKALSSSTMSR